MEQLEIIHDLKAKYEILRDQQLHTEALRKSEEGTNEREHKRIREEIEAINKKYFDIIYNRGSGIAFEVDRLKKESDERKKMKTHVWLLTGTLLIGIIIEIIRSAIK